ncbi:FkbM family methyltransferase [Desulfitobacterium hafniense]|uniref:Methyltransferase FkbM domain-containing protein n=1 Tax=Desulfitobacterium hafniense (strain Y51) TaxID=138119 RepID=Q24T46_DESHY|nr:FkbM family methyltransferase [Desulfitobacterium hafniense]BAE84796.1 hypothetical protein DSY3007 [Desulfitobacterium hafniense Y51]
MPIDFLNQITSLRAQMGDELSKQLFDARLLYSLTGNIEYFGLITIGAPSTAFAHPFAIFGCGGCGQFLHNLIPGAVCFIDNYADKDQVVCGLPVVSPDTFAEDYSDTMIVIGTTDYYDEVIKQLQSRGLPYYTLDAYTEMWKKSQYFDLPYLKAEKEELFIDGGCLDGKSSLDFIKWCGRAGTERCSVIAFEPNESQIPVCKKALESTGIAFSIIPKGLSDGEYNLRFNSSPDAPLQAGISNDGDIEIVTTALDNVLNNENVTFIKLDIEGEELKALEGMKETIRRCKPKLALSIYHKSQDIWELPTKINAIATGYQFYLRHYSCNLAETVLYALPTALY